MERTMMNKYGLKYGSIVRIEGTGVYDGEYQIQDTMNKRFAGQEKIDILPYHDMGKFKWIETQGSYPLEGVRVATSDDVEKAKKILHLKEV